MLTREYRNMDLELRAREDGEENENLHVRGYASTFDPYLLYRDGETEVFEVIDPHAFDETDMTDVVLRVNHEGAVYARNKKAANLELGTDEHGLWFDADLSKTENQRRLFEDIEAGLYPCASFAFTVADGGADFDRKTNVRTIYKIAKLFDVSPVSFPANPGTELDVSTRDFIHGEMEVERAERLAQEERAAKIKELTERIERLKNGN